MLVKFIQHKAHAVHQAIHVCRFPIFVSGTLMSGQRCLEGFEIVHPFQSEIMRLDVRFVENQDEWKLGFVKNTADRE